MTPMPFAQQLVVELAQQYEAAANARRLTRRARRNRRSNRSS
jgi:hypothetical protein